MSGATAELEQAAVEAGVFARVVCGLDESAESLHAASQARQLAAAGELMLVAVADVAKAAHAGFQAAPVARQIVDGAGHALAQACTTVHADRLRLARGRPETVLARTIASTDATLVALGATLHGRVSEVVVGTVASAVLRSAPCSVLLARAPRSSERWPEQIVLGVDGSLHSARASAVAVALAHRFQAALRVVTATAGKPTDVERIHARHPDVEVDPRPPVDALADAARTADLVVVGSRGLHGWRALGSVSERVAQRASCSVLVVRGAAPGADGQPPG